MKNSKCERTVIAGLIALEPSDSMQTHWNKVQDNKKQSRTHQVLPHRVWAPHSEKLEMQKNGMSQAACCTGLFRQHVNTLEASAG